MDIQCAGCYELLWYDEAIAYWPVDDPDKRGYVCRPDITKLNPNLSPEGRDCFRRVVADRTIHAIGVAQ